ncbi:Hypothetical_protein [Hexamita inflata]|uniref:Hypothetical_protein n=1 Tax=Hexamita inflata TaxID=28002 RepID=A0AA86NIL5_9EUKA|nr:Hypothetical protein HINF_LOCUS7535 [Hexamita inflata]CAI9937086.1 Hypothetical protein HINF_LOCUS24731 [Hexamita inflata]
MQINQTLLTTSPLISAQLMRLVSNKLFIGQIIQEWEDYRDDLQNISFKTFVDDLPDVQEITVFYCDFKFLKTFCAPKVTKFESPGCKNKSLKLYVNVSTAIIEQYDEPELLFNIQTIKRYIFPK